ncbi:MAG TPA: amidohydrolase family protein, partial [Acidimicrobiia bacterium]
MITRIEAKRLIPGRGPVVDDAVVIVDDVITFAGKAGDAPETAGADVVQTDTVMPGMWECHGHFMGIYTANIPEAFLTRPQLAAMRVTKDAKAVLQSGFTSVREMGGLGALLGRAVEEGAVEGPNVYGSGSMLSMTAGHGDSHSLDLPVSRLLHTHTWGEDNIVDGPDECRAGVRRMLRLGAKVIKVHASGGVLSELDDPHLPQFSKPELEAIVDEATRMERLVGAHCHGKRGIMAALEAGIKTIEHGTFLDEEAAEAMVETGAILVPTRFIVDLLVREGEERGLPASGMKKIEMVAESHASAV